MVPSDEIPNAILKIRIVDGLNRIPIYPIIPAVIISGIIQGSFESKIILKDLNKANPTMVINKISINKLSNKLRSK